MTADHWFNLTREPGVPAGETLPLWAPTAGARVSPPAEATTDLAPVGEAGPAENPISIEQIEQIQRAVEARGAEAAGAWPPRETHARRIETRTRSDFAADFRDGEAMAREWIAGRGDLPDLLHIVRDMLRGVELGGLVAGFLSTMDAAVRGDRLD